MAAQPCSADWDDTPVPLPNWTHGDEGDGLAGAIGAGIITGGKSAADISPVIAEIDGNAANGKEVAIGTEDGMLHVYRADGTLLWARTLPNYACTATKANNKLMSSPSVGELRGNGVPYVVVGYGGFGSSANPCGGGVIAFRGPDGGKGFHFDLKKYWKRKGSTPFSYTVFSTPAIADVNGDGKLEVGFGSWDHHVYVLNAKGKVMVDFEMADTVWSSAAFANVDNQPDLELLIGSDITQNLHLRPPTYNGGYVSAFKVTGRSRGSRVGFRGGIWHTYIPQTIMSTPVIGEVLPSNAGPEVIIGTGCYFPSGTNDKLGKFVSILNPKTGKILKQLETEACSSSSVAIGDLDDDGLNEIVATVNGNNDVGGTGRGYVVAWKATEDGPLWETIPRLQAQNDSYLGHFQSPVIADVDGNGSLEVVLSNAAGIVILNGKTGESLTCESRDCEGEGKYRLFASRTVKSTPAIGDVNNDGKLDIVTASTHENFGASGALYAWTDLEIILESPAGLQSPYSAPWPMLGGNAQRSGRAD